MEDNVLIRNHILKIAELLAQVVTLIDNMPSIVMVYEPSLLAKARNVREKVFELINEISKILLEFREETKKEK